MILHEFFAAAAAFDEDALAKLLHPEARISEMPNAINPEGTERDVQAALAAFRKGKALLARQSYEVHEVLEAGGRIAARATWRGKLDDGAELAAEIATFTEVRDGRIFPPRHVRLL
jgi:ketosteroid isomerase-like protein